MAQDTAGAPARCVACLCGVLGHFAPVYRCARLVGCFACEVSWATWLLFTSCFACAVSWATWLLFTSVPAKQEPRTPHTQHNTSSGHTGEQEPSGPGHRTSKATHQAGTPVNRSQVAQDAAHTCTRRAAEGEKRTNTPWVGRTGATQPTHRASSRGCTPRPLVRARPGCIGDGGKHQPEPWKQPLTGEPVHSPGGHPCQAERPRNSSHKGEAGVL